MRKGRKACVIGAGPSGITAIKNLLDQGIEVIAYDKNSDVGGNWIFSEDTSHSSVFETTHIISSRSLSEYADFTFDDFEQGIPDYPSHDHLRRYFQAYAKHFDLYPHISFDTLVKHCQRTPEGHWLVTTDAGGENSTEEFTDLVVCNGHHWLPRYPEYPGEFTGEYLHSHNYKKAETFRDKKVLVIGGGNSACDVSVETSRVSKKTSISWRRGYHIVPKFLFGQPSDVLASRLLLLPISVRYWLSSFLIRLFSGPNEKYGLQKPSQKFGASHPTVNDELLYKIRHGKVFPKKDIASFDGMQVSFKDGSTEEFDVVIACTGYVLSHPFFDKDFIDYSQSKVPLYLKMIHEEYDNLFFVGMFQPLGCIWPAAELQSKIVARAINGLWTRPPKIKELCHKEIKHPHIKQIDTPRHTITVDYHKFVKDLKKHLPKDYIRKERR